MGGRIARLAWVAVVLGAAALPSCAGAPRRADVATRHDFDVVTRGSPGDAVLRRHARPVPPGADLGVVVRRMAATLERTGGIGIAAPQVGLSERLVIVKLDRRTGRPRIVAAVNPVIVERSDDVRDSWEGCLSIPDVGGLVRRSRAVTVEYEEAATREPRRERAEHDDAILWQHEIDHLDGVLWIDRRLGEPLPMEEVRRLRKELDARMGR